MRRYQLHTIALALIWIGAIEVVASFLVKVWFQIQVQFTPYFFLALLVGIGLYIIARIISK